MVTRSPPMQRLNGGKFEGADTSVLSPVAFILDWMIIPWFKTRAKPLSWPHASGARLSDKSEISEDSYESRKVHCC